MRSRTTGWFRIGSTTIRPCWATSGPTGVWQASRLLELMSMAQEPQMALRQEYRSASVESSSSRIRRRAERTGVWGASSRENRW